jgi:hypothetical protein
LGRVVGRRSIGLAGRWLLLIGALATLPAATTGIYAQYDVVRTAGDDDGAPVASTPWYRLMRDAAARMNADRWSGLKWHVLRMAGGAAAVVLLVLPASRAPAGPRRRETLAASLVLLASGFMVCEAWNAHARAAAADAGDAIGLPDVHATLAGLTVALALSALAFARPRRGVETRGSGHGSTGPARPAHATLVWLTTAVIAIATAALGVRIAGVCGNWERVRAVLAQPRDLVHAALGFAIVALSVTLAALARRRGRSRPRTTRALGAMLLAALILQLAMGTLLLYDGSGRGAPVWRVRPPTVQRPTALDGE